MLSLWHKFQLHWKYFSFNRQNSRRRYTRNATNLQECILGPVVLYKYIWTELIRWSYSGWCSDNSHKIAPEEHSRKPGFAKTLAARPIQAWTNRPVKTNLTPEQFHWVKSGMDLSHRGRTSTGGALLRRTPSQGCSGDDFLGVRSKKEGYERGLALPVCLVRHWIPPFPWS